MKKRELLFDNMRALLIFLVVLGHMLRPNAQQSLLLYTVYIFIYSFHMAAFVFLSGYFSKNVEKCRSNAFVSFFIPYILLNCLSFIRDLCLGQTDGQPFRFFDPLWGAWFLWALFFWRLLLKDIIRIRFIFIFSIIFGLLCGFSGEFASHMSIGRIFSFLPFFLLGYYCNASHIKAIRRIPKWVAISIAGFFACASYISAKYKLLSFESLYLRSDYVTRDEYAWYANPELYQRIFLYFSAFCMIFVLINLVSATSKRFSFIGENSITIYILHLFIVPFLKELNLFHQKPICFFLYAILCSILIVLLTGLPIVKQYYNLLLQKMNALLFLSKQSSQNDFPSQTPLS